MNGKGREPESERERYECRQWGWETGWGAGEAEEDTERQESKPEKHGQKRGNSTRAQQLESAERTDRRQAETADREGGLLWTWKCSSKEQVEVSAYILTVGSVTKSFKTELKFGIRVRL